MKFSLLIKQSVYSALVFFGALLVLSIGYATYSSMTLVDSGEPLTKDLWNQMIGNLEDHEERISGISGDITSLSGTVSGISGTVTSLSASVSALQVSAGNLWATVTGGIGYSGGNVGIGIANPGYKLDVNGTVNATAFRGDGSGLTGIAVPWSGISGKPTTVSAFTNDSGFITSAGRAYPRTSGGGDLNFNWLGQWGQPPWLWWGSDGANMYVYNPSNFSVNYAASAGSVAWAGVTGKPATFGITASTYVTCYTDGSGTCSKACATGYFRTGCWAYGTPNASNGCNFSTGNSSTPCYVFCAK